MPLGQRSKTENRSNIVTNLIKTKKKKKNVHIKKVLKETAWETDSPLHPLVTGVSWGLFWPPCMRSPGPGSPPGSSAGCGLASVPSAPTEVGVPRATSASAFHMGHSLRVQSPKPSLGDCSGPSASLPLTFSAIQIPAIGHQWRQEWEEEMQNW